MFNSILHKLQTLFGDKKLKEQLSETNTLKVELEGEEIAENESLLSAISYMLEDFKPTYETKNNVFSTNHSITFGIEIEFKFKEPRVEELLDFLMDNQLSYEKMVLEKKEAKIRRGWKLSEEAHGVYELISPVLTDLEVHWSQISLICDKLTSIGAYTDEFCAFHVHIGSNGLFSCGRQWINLRNIYRSMEPITYLLSAGTDKAVPRKRIEYYAVPLIIADESLYCKGIPLDVALTMIENNEDDDDFLLKTLYPFKIVGFNLINLVHDDYKTIEFRTFNGTLNSTLIQTYILYVASIVEKSVNEKLEFSDHSVSDIYYKALYSEEKEEFVQIKLSFLMKNLDFITVDSNFKKRLLWYMSQNSFKIPKYAYDVLQGRLSEEKRRSLKI